jgi:hypothetical protein
LSNLIVTRPVTVFGAVPAVQVASAPEVSAVNVTGAHPGWAAAGGLTFHLTVTSERNQPPQSLGAGEHA